MPKSSLDWWAIVSLWVGTAIMAIKAGDLHLIEGAPLWFASRAWGYVPFVLVTFYLFVALGRLRTPAPQHIAPKPSEPEAAKQIVAKVADPPATRDETKSEPDKAGQRIVLPRKITPEYLFALREGKTEAQLSRAVAPYLGKWMYVSGEVQDVGIREKSGEMHIGLKGVSQIDGLGKLITGFFDHDLDRLEMYEKNDEVMVCGCLEAVGSLGMRLVRCELVD